MSSRLDPLISEFETEAQAESYDRWFRAKVLAAMNSPAARLGHDEAMARVDAELERRRQADASPPVD